MTRMGQFVDGEQTLAVGILESVVLTGKPDALHKLDMGQWIYAASYSDLRRARAKYSSHIWVNKNGRRVCIFPVHDVFKQYRRKPKVAEEPKPEPVPVESNKDKIKRLRAGFKPEFGNQSHIWLLQSVRELDRQYGLKTQNKSRIESLEKQIINTLESYHKAPDGAVHNP